MERKSSLIVLAFVFVVLSAMMVSASAPSWTVSGTTSNGTEDSLFTYDFSLNVTNTSNPTYALSTLGGGNPILSSLYGGSHGASFYYWINLNSTTGLLTINSTNDNESGLFNISVDVINQDTQSAGARFFYFNISSRNDPPVYVGLQNQTFTVANFAYFNYLFNLTDEENDGPYTMNVTFLNCSNSNAPWSTRDCSTVAGRTLFNVSNSSQFYFNSTSGKANITILPTTNDLGNFTIGFNVTDSGNPNASTNQNVTFSFIQTNSAPVFNYTCSNENYTLWGKPYICYINVTDFGELSNLTLRANQTWFLFNGTGVNNITLPVNSSTGFASFMANFTPAKTNVGNWTILLNVTDTGTPRQTTLAKMNLFINNTNDNCSLQSIDDKIYYITSNYSFNINASDNDFLIPDKTVYNESISFSSNVSWLNFTTSGAGLGPIAGTNITRAKVNVYPGLAGVGDYQVNVSIHDSNNFSRDYKIFRVQVLDNAAPSWNSSTQTNFSFNEKSQFYLNLSQNVSKPGDTLTFDSSCSLDSCASEFPSFDSGFNKSSGVMNFTAGNLDVGQHNVTIYAIDSKGASVPEVFNFTVNNVNDPITFENITALSSNYTVDSRSNINASEENLTNIVVYFDDNDFLIQTNQNSFYNQTISFNWSVSGVNQSILNFVHVDGYPQRGVYNKDAYEAVFMPRKSDAGNYSVTLNVSDGNGGFSTMSFNMTIKAINHPPSFPIMGTQNASILEPIGIDVNASDTEDGSESSGNLTFHIYNLTKYGNFLNVNSTGMITNATPMIINNGTWNYTVVVTDLNGANASQNFSLNVYDYPQIVFPDPSYVFNLTENSTSRLVFSATHSVGDNLSYTSDLNGSVLSNGTMFGNGTPLSFNYTPPFESDTSCSGPKMMNMNVSNAKFYQNQSWQVNIEHVNSPVSFSGKIGNGNPAVLQVTNAYTLDLTNNFDDLDARNACHGQPIGFIVNQLSADGVAVSITNWTNTSSPKVVFSSGVPMSANYSITAIEYNESNLSQQIGNVTSNQFTVSVDVVTTQVITGGGSSGGGGATTTVNVPVSLKLLLPGPISSDKQEKIVLPITLFNDGQIALNNVSLQSSIVINGSIAKDVVSSFDVSTIASLVLGQKQNVTLTINVNTESEGLYEINVNATSQSPRYNDWGKIYLTVKSGLNVEKKIIFTEQLIVDNPECAEVKELVDSARKSFDSGNLTDAEKKIDMATNACKKSIEQTMGTNRKVLGVNVSPLVYYLIGAVVLAMVLGIGYYLYYRARLRRSLLGYE